MTSDQLAVLKATAIEARERVMPKTQTGATT